MHPVIVVLTALKFFLGLTAIALGIHQSDPNLILFGAGHSFILAPLWILSEKWGF
jgi:hypothetical protein